MKKMNMSDKISAMERWYKDLKSLAKYCDEIHNSTFEDWEKVIAANDGHLSHSKQQDRNVSLTITGTKRDVVNEILGRLERDLPFLKDIDT